MDKNDIIRIQEQIGYNFKNQDLLIQAFTRRSYTMEHGGENNEVLEFIGDKVLDLSVVRLLSERFGHFTIQEQGWTNLDKVKDAGFYQSMIDEGKLTDIKKRLTQKNTLANAIYNLDLEPYLIMGQGDIQNHVEESASVKEDLFEALLGAITLDSNWDMKTILDVVEVMLNPDEIIDSDDLNYVAEIQAWSLNESGTIPLHRFLSASMESSWYMGHDSRCMYGRPARDTKFLCELQFEGVRYHFVGYGHSKSAARKEAAKLAYKYLEENHMLFSIKDEIENPSRDMAINQLEILARRDYFSIPVYNFFETFDCDGNPIWKCQCCIAEKNKYFEAVSSVKKQAKKDAAWEMLQYVLELNED